jgi:hypothetical protein
MTKNYYEQILNSYGTVPFCSIAHIIHLNLSKSGLLSNFTVRINSCRRINIKLLLWVAERLGLQ